MIGDRGVIGHQAMAEPRPEPFVDIEPQAHRPAPFRPLPLDAVHVDEDLLALRPQRREKRGGVVAEHEANAFLRGGVPDRVPVE